jgi:hypothetical protein
MCDSIDADDIVLDAVGQPVGKHPELQAAEVTRERGSQVRKLTQELNGAIYVGEKPVRGSSGLFGEVGSRFRELFIGLGLGLEEHTHG